MRLGRVVLNDREAHTNTRSGMRGDQTVNLSVRGFFVVQPIFTVCARDKVRAPAKGKGWTTEECWEQTFLLLLLLLLLLCRRPSFFVHIPVASLTR